MSWTWTSQAQLAILAKMVVPHSIEWRETAPNLKEAQVKISAMVKMNRKVLLFNWQLMMVSWVVVIDPTSWIQLTSSSAVLLVTILNTKDRQFSITTVHSPNKVVVQVLHPPVDSICKLSCKKKFNGKNQKTTWDTVNQPKPQWEVVKQPRLSLEPTRWMMDLQRLKRKLSLKSSEQFSKM